MGDFNRIELVTEVQTGEIHLVAQNPATRNIGSWVSLPVDTGASTDRRQTSRVISVSVVSRELPLTMGANFLENGTSGNIVSLFCSCDLF